jgi:hypothetical protein
VTVEEILAHHGIKGMHWGVRKSVSEHIPTGHNLGPGAETHTQSGSKIKYIHEHAAGKAEVDRIVREHGIQAVSNHQLRTANERTQLENQYKQGQPATTGQKAATSGKKFAGELLKDTGKQEVRKALAKQLAKKAAKTAVTAAIV